tara:strand:- start:189 stop:293 length:105 start_codon:yes stop_codon:yes gene_type:complete
VEDIFLRQNTMAGRGEVLDKKISRKEDFREIRKR